MHASAGISGKTPWRNKHEQILLAAALALLATPALAFDVGIVAFQMSSETHARVANAAKAAAKAQKGWKVQVLNSEGSLPKHANSSTT